MAAKKKSAPKASVEEKPVKPQFVTEVVEDVSEEALETIKEDAKEIEEVVTDIQEKQEVADSDGEIAPVEEAKPEEEQKKAEEKEVLAEIFTKEPPPKVYPQITEHKRNGTSSVFLWAVIIIGVALLTGGTLLVIASGLPKLPTLLTKPTPTPTPAPTPTPTPASVSRADIKLQVLNGGGTPGSAGKAKSFLEDKGYTVENVGNTDEYTYDETEIHGKPGREAYLEMLKTDLSDEYTIGTASADLPADSPYDAQVIVGK